MYFFYWCLKLTDPPEEIKRNGIKTIMYLRNILRRSEGYYTMKLMLVGKAAQGKTTLKYRLMRNYSYNDNNSTNGENCFHSSGLYKDTLCCLNPQVHKCDQNLTSSYRLNTITFSNCYSVGDKSREESWDFEFVWVCSAGNKEGLQWTVSSYMLASYEINAWQCLKVNFLASPQELPWMNSATIEKTTVFSRFTRSSFSRFGILVVRKTSTQHINVFYPLWRCTFWYGTWRKVRQMYRTVTILLFLMITILNAIRQLLLSNTAS